jgi:hypothetical protein
MRFSGALGKDQTEMRQAGNGGKMAQARKELSASNVEAKTGGTTGSEGGKRARREYASRKDGAERLRQAADRRVGRNSEKLADLLTARALEGNLASAKTLIGLAAAKKPIPERVKKQRGLSLAEKWANEPQWTGNLEDLEKELDDEESC